MQIITNKIQGGSHNDRQGGGKPRPYPVRVWLKHILSSFRVRAGLASILICRFMCLLSIAFFIGAALISLAMFPSQKAQAQGNVFIVAMLGSTQPPGFAPDLLAVHVYDTVVFTNQTNTPTAVVAVDNSFSSPAIAPGQQWKVTFNSAGAIEYHENSTTPHTVGEIVVVPNNVALLPSPLPYAQETAIAFIKAGKTPPDSVWQQATPQISAPGVKHPTTNRTASTLSVPPLALLMTFVRPVILIVIIILVVFASGLCGLWLYRRLKSRKKDDDDDDEDDIDE